MRCNTDFFLRKRVDRWGLSIGVFGLVATVGSAQVPGQTLVGEEGCPETSPAASHVGATLQQFAGDSNAGIVFDNITSALQLKRAGGQFEPTVLPVTDTFNSAVAGDFDEDGWTDLVVGRDNNRFLRFYKNRTYENPAPDWYAVPIQTRTPKFVRTHDIAGSQSRTGWMSFAAGDFDGDGHLDLFYTRNGNPIHSYVNQRHIRLGNGDGTFQAPYNATTSSSVFGYTGWQATNVVPVDWNGDGWLDFLFGTKLSSSSSSGALLVFINNCPDVATSPPTKCSQNPQFTRTILKSNVNLGSRGMTTIAYGDVTGDGLGDLGVHVSHVLLQREPATSLLARQVRRWSGVNFPVPHSSWRVHECTAR